MATRKLGLSPLLRAIYDRLEADTDTTAYSVYNYVPRTTTMPYITFGSPIALESRMLGSRDTEGESNVVIIHVWSQQAGEKECADVMAHVIDAICGTALSITGYFTPVDVGLDYADITMDVSDSTRPVYHGVLRFRFEMAPS